MIREVRGLGLMIGIELKQKVAPYLRLMNERQCGRSAAGLTGLRLLPPLVITYEQMDQVVSALEQVLCSTCPIVAPPRITGWSLQCDAMLPPTRRLPLPP